MRNICLFVHYGETSYLPTYVKVFTNELARYFEQVVLLYNKRPLIVTDNELAANISLVPCENKGYDFGIYYNYLKNNSIEGYDELALINDSNVLINSLSGVFEWVNISPAHLLGLVDSNEKPWFSKHKNNYHIQSHFMLLRGKAIQSLFHYFSQINIDEFYKETDKKKLRRMVIDKWEIGLSRYLIENGVQSDSFLKSKNFIKHKKSKPGNILHKNYVQVIEAGVPIIKKRLILKQKWYEAMQANKNWKVLLEKHGNRNWPIKSIIEEMEMIRK
jgi:lipopolysaccharide biosynthesis protein